MRCLLILASLAIAATVVAQTASRDAPAATVNGQTITVAEVDAALAAQLPGVILTVAQGRDLRARVLDDLIDDLLLKQFLANHAPKADHTAELDAQTKALKVQLLRDNRTLADYLKQLGKSEAQLRETWTLQLQLAAYVKLRATDAELKAFHAANRDHFDRVEVRLSHVLIRAGRNTPPTERAKARERLKAIRAAIVARNLDFAAAARKFSECPTAADGGDLGYIRRRGMPEDEPIAKAAFALKPGELSDIIDTDYGFHILTVTDRKPGKPSVLEKCIVEVLEEYTDEYRVKLVKKLRAEGQIKITLP